MSGQVLRLALINAHYRQSLDWNDELIKNCQNTLDKWYSIYTKVETFNSNSYEILEPLLDDLNTPGYIAKLHELYSKAVKGNDLDKNYLIKLAILLAYYWKIRKNGILIKK